MKSSYGTSFVGDKRYPEFKMCSILHDVNYEERRLSRKVADDRFSSCMSFVINRTKDPKRRRQLIMARAQRMFMVRLLGWIMWYT